MKKPDNSSAAVLSQYEMLRRRVEELEEAEAWRKRAEEVLQRSQAELTAVFDHAPLPMLILDEDRVILKANRAAVELADRPEEDVLGLRGGEAFRCLNADNGEGGCGYGAFCRDCVLRRVVAETFETGAGRYREPVSLPVARGEGGKTVHLRVTTAVLHTAGAPRLLVCLEDVTELRETTEALARLGAT
ncbi:MAG: PAS domain-containing protein [Kiritimatiellae bacterium]|nr:PAS domain-containing protein [Kiritimatiellia bacterium]